MPRPSPRARTYRAALGRRIAAPRVLLAYANESDRVRLIAVIPISNANVGSRRYPPLSGGHVGWQLLQKPVFQAQRCGSASREAPRLPANDRSRDLRTDALDRYQPVRLLQSCPMLTARFSTFASTKRPFVTSGSRPTSVAHGRQLRGELKIIEKILTHLGLQTHALPWVPPRGLAQRADEHSPVTGAQRADAPPPAVEASALSTVSSHPAGGKCTSSSLSSRWQRPRG